LSQFGRIAKSLTILTNQDNLTVGYIQEKKNSAIGLQDFNSHGELGIGVFSPAMCGQR
jgi:hypothetical protein